MVKYPYAPVAQWIELPPPKRQDSLGNSDSQSVTYRNSAQINLDSATHLNAGIYEMNERVFEQGSPPPAPANTGQQVAGKSLVVRRSSEHDVYIGRPSKWGNPFVIGRDGDRAEVIAKYEAWLLSRPALMESARRELRGKRLGCYCAPLPCHGDVLARIANEGATP